MENKLFSEIAEFNNIEHIFTKFKNDEMNMHTDNISYINVKSAFFYTFGTKIKKKLLKNILKMHLDNDSEEINLEEFKTLFYYIKSHGELNKINDHELILTFYNYLKDGKEDVDFNAFKVRIKENFPNLSNLYIEEVFLRLIEKNKEGKVRLSDLENYLLLVDIK